MLILHVVFFIVAFWWGLLKVCQVCQFDSELNGENCEAWAGMGLGGWEGYGKWKFMYETKQQLSQIGFFEMSKHSQRFSRI